MLVEDPAVDATAQVLNEVPVEFRVDIPNHALGVDLDSCPLRACLAAQEVRGGG